jgi:hypothetical protein
METEKFKCDILDGESLGVYARRLRDRVEELEVEVERLREERDYANKQRNTYFYAMRTDWQTLVRKREAAEAEVERLMREIDLWRAKRILERNRAEEAERLVVLYSGEGKDDLPEEAEYRRLASIPSDKRTPQQTERLLYLARWIPTQLDDKILRTRIAELEGALRELADHVEALLEGDEPEVPGGICGIAPDNLAPTVLPPRAGRCDAGGVRDTSGVKWWLEMPCVLRQR